MPCAQIGASRLGSGNTSTVYVGVWGETAWTGSAPASGGSLARWSSTYKNFTFVHASAPGTSKSFTYTLVKNGVDTAIVITIADSATQGRSTGSVSVVAGDQLYWRRESTGTPTLSEVQYSVELHHSASFISGYTGIGDVSGTLGYNTPLFTPTFGSNTVPNNQNSLVAAAGNLTELYFKLSVAPGTGKSYEFAVSLNGVTQDGAGGTTDTRVTISDAATTGSWSGTLALAAGDYATLVATPSNTPANANCAATATFTASTDGESQFCGGQFGSDMQRSAGTSYYVPAGRDCTINATESNVLVRGSVTSFTLKKFRARMNGTTGSNVTHTTRRDSSSPTGTPSATITAGNQTSHDSTGEVTIADGQTLALEEVRAGDPGVARSLTWSWVQYSLLSTYTTTLDPGAFTVTGTDMSSLSFTDDGLTVFIAGTDRTSRVRTSTGRRTLRLQYSLGGDWIAEFPTFDTTTPAASAYRPDLDEAVLVVYRGQLIHKGNIYDRMDRPWGGSTSGVEMAITSKANRVTTDQVVVTKEYAAGLTLKTIVHDLFNTYIAPNFDGYVLDPAMLDGPTITQTVSFDAAPLQDAFNRLRALTGWIIRVTPNDVLESFEPGTKVCAYALTAANGLAKVLGASGSVIPVVTWKQTRRNFVNRAYVRYGTGVVERTQTFAAATAGQTQWELDVPGVGANLRGYILVDDVATPISIYGVDDPATHPWQWDAATNSIRRTPGASGGEVVSVTYDAAYPGIVSAEDAASIASVGLWERTFDAPDVFEPDEATELAEGYLRVNSSAPKIVTVTTREYPMPLPGDVINLHYADRLIDNENYLITQVEAQDVLDEELEFRLTCVEGTEARESWTDQLRSAIGV